MASHGSLPYESTSPDSGPAKLHLPNSAGRPEQPKPLLAKAPTMTKMPMAKMPVKTPAIAIKPKPIVAAPAGPKAAFNPRYDPSAPTTIIDRNINTLRKWVLPPRPRPGRRPNLAPAPTLMPKKKRKNCGAAITPEPEPRLPLPPPEAYVELQAVYLERLKEQEVLQNYIDVLGNQIKDLRFAQSGVVAVDALSDAAHAQAPEQLHQVTNMHDLDQLLQLQTKPCAKPTSKSLQQQIVHYLELRAKHRGPPRRLLDPVVRRVAETLSFLQPLKLNLVDVEDVLVENDEKKKACGFCTADTPCLCFDDGLWDT